VLAWWSWGGVKKSIVDFFKDIVKEKIPGADLAEAALSAPAIIESCPSCQRLIQSYRNGNCQEVYDEEGRCKNEIEGKLLREATPMGVYATAELAAFKVIDSYVNTCKEKNECESKD
jgi:hypothetical protein